MVNKVDTKVIQEHKLGDRAPCPIIFDPTGDSTTNLAKILNALDNRVKVKSISFEPTISQDTETDSGWDLPAKALVLDVVVLVETADSGVSLDVGLKSSETGGDADGFLDGVSLGSTGLVQGALTVTKTAGTNENYISAVSCTRGVLLRSLEYELGSDTGGDHGFVAYERKPYYAGSATAKSVTYTPKGGDLDSGKGKIYIVYADLSQAGEL